MNLYAPQINFFWGGGAKKSKTRFRPIFSPFQVILNNFDFFRYPIKFISANFHLVRPIWVCTQNFRPIRPSLKLVGDGPTDGQTDGPTDRRTLSRIELLSQLKIEIKLKLKLITLTLYTSVPGLVGWNRRAGVGPCRSWPACASPSCCEGLSCN